MMDEMQKTLARRRAKVDKADEVQSRAKLIGFYKINLLDFIKLKMLIVDNAA